MWLLVLIDIWLIFKCFISSYYNFLNITAGFPLGTAGRRRRHLKRKVRRLWFQHIWVLHKIFFLPVFKFISLRWKLTELWASKVFKCFYSISKPVWFLSIEIFFFWNQLRWLTIYSLLHLFDIICMSVYCLWYRFRKVIGWFTQLSLGGVGH